MAAAARPISGPAITTALPQSIIRQVVPSAAIPSAADVSRTLLPAALGAAVALTPTMILYPNHSSLFAGLAFVTGSVMAASAPPLTLAQEIGLGAAIASGTWLVTRAFHEIKLPPATAAAVADIPPVDLGNGAQLAFTRRVA